MSRKPKAPAAAAAASAAAAAGDVGDDSRLLKFFVKSTKGKSGPQRKPHTIYTELLGEEVLLSEPGLEQELQELLKLRENKKNEWETKTKDVKVWNDEATLNHILITEMMLTEMLASDQPTAVILTGPAGSGKSAALPMVGLGIQKENTVIVDPDRIFEWFAGKYGYFPPEIKMEDPKRYATGESDEEYKQRCEVYRARLRVKNLDRLRWWIANKGTFEELYGNDFDDNRVHERRFEAAKYCTSKTAGVLGQYRNVLPQMSDMIFETANPKSGNRLNVLLDTTGGMQEGFLEDMATRLKDANYRVVVVLVVSSEDDCVARVSNDSGRNAQQHRQIDEFTVKKIWRDFVENNTSCRWESFSHDTGAEFVVVQNTWTPTKEDGSARVIFRRSEGRPVPVDSAAPLDSAASLDSAAPLDSAELSQILATYNVTVSKNKAGVPRFMCNGNGNRKRYRGEGGYRKRRISTQRLHIKRPRKTMKKYVRRVTRGRSRGHSRVGRRHTRHTRR